MKRVPTAAALMALACALAGTSAAAQTIIASPRPAQVDVTVYRDPNRQPDQAPNLNWLNGYALISETRQVELPAGESDIRFEGVAGGILPQSAIVTGLPDGIVERNRDAYLLSPATILDRSLGRRVHLRRTSRATGAVREHDAIVRSGANGAVVLETEDGFEALRCTGLPETIVYDRVPPELSAVPTLSVRTRSSQPVSATVTLSYLASGFDWQADYVATLSPEGDRMELFAWLTLANGDETSFRDADTQAVAGRLNREYARPAPSEGGPLRLRCWPAATTSDIPEEEYERIEIGGLFDRFMSPPPPPPPSPPPPPPPPVPMAAMQAQQENLGDLKLYRIPEPVTVAANSQKQVALMQRPSVKVRTVYRYGFYPNSSTVAGTASRVLVTRNRAQEGLGLPLPAGRLMLFSSDGPRSLLIGQGTVRDHAIGEDVEIRLGAAPGVRVEARLLSNAERVRDYELVVTNAQPRPIQFESELASGGLELRTRAPLGRRDGSPLWTVTVPANGTASLRFSMVERGG